jgi:predicted GH43/DUF377 family glycosyl hydrolase
MKNSKISAFKHEVIVGPEDFTPSSSDLEVLGVCNPGVTTIDRGNGLETLLMVRVTETPKEKCESAIHLPYYKNLNPNNPHPEIGFDVVQRDDDIEETSKDVRFKAMDEKKEEYKCMRLKHISHPKTIIIDKAGKITHRPDLHLFPACGPDEFGMEDVRITKVQDPKIISEVGGKYILTYVVPHRRHGVGTIISITDDFKNFERLPFGNTPKVIPGKDIIIFPEKCLSVHKPLRKRRRRQYVGFRRPSEHDGIKTPGMVVDYSPDLVSWGPSHEITWEITKGKTTGIGTPPIRLGDSWFSAFHEAVPYSNKKDAEKAGHTHFYHTKFMTLDLKEPWRIKEISDVILKRADFDKILPKPGYVPNVDYVTGLRTTFEDGIITFYSGVDDTWVVGSSFYEEDVRKEMGV